MNVKRDLSLKLTYLGLLLTAAISVLFFIVKKIFLSLSFYEALLLSILFFSSIAGCLILYKKPKYLKIIQIVIYIEIIVFVFLISYLLKSPLELLWFYLTLLSSFIITDKKTGLFIAVFSFILLILYQSVMHLALNDFLTLIFSLIIFTFFSYLSVTVIETYETQRKRYEEKIKEMAQKDFLTGIYNRRAFFHLAKSCLNQNRGVLMIDIDYFKKINDTYGHAVGDVVLKEVTKRIQSLLRDEDIFARIGGEEFVILLNSVNKESLIKKAKEINEKIKNEKIENINVTISVGGYLFKDKNIEIAMKKADEALYKAKEKRDSVVIF